MRQIKNSILNSFKNSGKRHLLITGRKGIGKTALFQRLKQELGISEGFHTYVIPKESVMLELEENQETICIANYIPKEGRKPMYPNYEGFTKASMLLNKTSNAEWYGMDEIGFLENEAEDFKMVIRKQFNTKRVLAVLRKEDLSFLNELRDREDIFYVDLDEFYPKVGCVIMASGISKRFGENKLLVKFDEESLFEKVLSCTNTSLFEKRVVVTRTKEVVDLCKEKHIEVIYHQYEDRNDALRLGLTTMLHLDACMFVPCDQPLLTKTSIETIIETYRNEDKGILRLSYEEQVGTPILFAQKYYHELLQLPTKKGGSYVVKQHEDDVAYIQAIHKNELVDVDTKEELEKLRDTIL